MSDNLTPFRKRVRDTAKDYLMEATVIDAVGSRCSVRLAQNGQAMHGLRYSGVKPVPGQRVQVDFISGAPLVMTGAATAAAEPAAEPIPAAPVNSEQVEPDYSGILRYHGGAIVAAYPANEEGMQSALDDCEEHDIIVLPIIELVMDVVMPTRITIKGESRETSKILGQVTMGLGTRLESLTVLHEEISESDIIAVVAPGPNNMYIDDCNLYAWNCSRLSAVPSAIGVHATGNSSSVLRITNSFIAAEMSGGAGIAAKNSGTGRIIIQNTPIYEGETKYVGDVEVYGTHASLSADGCPELPPTASFAAYYAHQNYVPNIYNHLAPATSEVDAATLVTGLFGSPMCMEYLSGKDYIYYVNWLTGTTAQVTRYKIEDGTTDSLVIPATIIPGGTRHKVKIALAEEDVIYVGFLFDYDGVDNYAIYQMDFGEDSIRLADLFAIEGGDYSSYNPPILDVVWISESVYKVVVCGVYNDTSDDDRDKLYFRSFDSDTWNVVETIAEITDRANDDYVCMQPYRAFVVGTKLYVPVSIDADAGDSDPSEVTVVRFDAENDLADKASIAGTNAQATHYLYHSALDTLDNRIYFVYGFPDGVHDGRLAYYSVDEHTVTGGMYLDTYDSILWFSSILTGKLYLGVYYDSTSYEFYELPGEVSICVIDNDDLLNYQNCIGDENDWLWMYDYADDTLKAYDINSGILRATLAVNGSVGGEGRLQLFERYLLMSKGYTSSQVIYLFTETE